MQEENALRVIFMGTPSFAVHQLEAIVSDSSVFLAAVFTQTDKPVGRKQILTPPPVKEWALAHKIPVYQPTKVRSPEFLDLIRSLKPDLIVVAAYGKILPKELLEIPPLGCLNVHGSLLPDLRGASPVQRSIEWGRTRTGVTLMYMDEGVDTGDMIVSDSVAIDDTDTDESLMEKLAVCGAALLKDALKALARGESLPRISQPDEGFTYAPMISREEAQVDFHLSAEEVDRKIRAFYSWPGAFTQCDGQTIQLVEARLLRDGDQPLTNEPGRVIDSFLVGKHPRFVVECGNHTALELLRIKPAGSSVMTGESYLRGHSLSGKVLGK